MKILVKSSSIEEDDLQAARELILSCMSGAEAVIRGKAVEGYPDGEEPVEDVRFFITMERIAGNLTGTGHAPEEGTTAKVVLSLAEITELNRLPVTGREKPEKVLIKKLLKELLGQMFGIGIPWGTLTGIRPSKLMHRMDDLEITEEEKRAILAKRYAVRSDKIELLEKIDRIQNPFLRHFKNYPREAAVYISIPFCPSRCSYCTFPGTVLKNSRLALEDYLAGLGEEIRQTGLLMKEHGLSAANLYLGGGTPTVLNEKEMDSLLTMIREDIPLTGDREFTVEAGRPDTITRDKLAVMKAHGVNRLSINPQSMEDNTLIRIGRAHSVRQVKEVYWVARSLHDWIINMDMILGLPGEGLAEVESTLRQIGLLRPDNLTVHVLALKRGSREWERNYRHREGSEIEAMGLLAEKEARSWGMEPYYLYRQRRMAGNLENIGYAFPGKECRYNIGIMEERQQILGLGAGAASKILDPATLKLENIQHAYDWSTYLQNWPKDHERRSARLSQVYTKI